MRLFRERFPIELVAGAPMIGAVELRKRGGRGALSGRAEATCEDCYFRQEGLCALLLQAPCPTFRLARRGTLVPPKQARLVPLPSVTKPELVLAR